MVFVSDEVSVVWLSDVVPVSEDAEFVMVLTGFCVEVDVSETSGVSVVSDTIGFCVDEVSRFAEAEDTVLVEVLSWVCVEVEVPEETGASVVSDVPVCVEEISETSSSVSTSVVVVLVDCVIIKPSVTVEAPTSELISEALSVFVI